MTCRMISDGTPDGMPAPSMSCSSGIITAWYGMNIPNRISVKTMSAPLKRQRASTKPFIEPRNDEMIAAGMTIWNVRHSDGDRACHAPVQFSVTHTCGRFHARAGEASPWPLKLVTMST